MLLTLAKDQILESRWQWLGAAGAVALIFAAWGIALLS